MLLQRARSQDRLPDVGVVTPADARALGAVGPAARASGHRRGRPRDRLAPRLRRLRGGRADRAGGDVAPGSSSAVLELRQSFGDPGRAARRPRRPARVHGPGGSGARSASVASRARAARPPASSSATGDRVERLRLRTGSYANWPIVAHAAAGQPAARLPADQQELRALLRLRRPLMLTLLRDLRRLRRSARPARPRPPREPGAPPRRRRLVQRLRARADACGEPVRRPAAVRPRHRRLAAPRRRPARHRGGHDPHARAACSPRTPRCPSPAVSSRSRRLRARLRPARLD